MICSVVRTPNINFSLHSHDFSDKNEIPLVLTAFVQTLGISSEGRGARCSRTTEPSSHEAWALLLWI